MGRCPPSFFNPAKRLAPPMKGATSSDSSPLARKLTRAARTDWNLLDLFWDTAARASFRCSGLIPSGPGAVPFLKDLMAFLTWVGEILIGGDGIFPSGISVALAAGCFLLISALASAEFWSIPLLTRALAAREYCPSCTSFMALMAFSWSWLSSSVCTLLPFFFLFPFWPAFCAFTASRQRAPASPFLHLCILTLTSAA